MSYASYFLLTSVLTKMVSMTYASLQFAKKEHKEHVCAVIGWLHSDKVGERYSFTLHLFLNPCIVGNS